MGEGLSLTFASQQGGGVGHVLIVPLFQLLLARFFINLTLIRSINFSVCISYSVLVVLLLQLLSYIDID